jgi:hypothetical protein
MEPMITTAITASTEGIIASKSIFRISYFELLPQDLLEVLLLYLDIPSIAVMCQTSVPMHGNISDLASRDQTWLRLINHRFNLFSARKNNVPRAKHYGGTTWKEAYNALSRTSRMPKMNVNFKKKSIFAKGCGYTMQRGSPNEGQHMKGIERLASSKQNHVQQFLACWVMINHTEDCNLRSSPMELITICDGRTTIGESLYIELQVAFQNTKSGFSQVDVDVCGATVQMLSATEDFITQRVIRSGPLRPKVIYRNSLVINPQPCEYLDDRCGQVLSLKPFEFVIVSLNVPLAYYRQHREVLQFETDFLSRTLSLQVPATCEIMEPIYNEQNHNSEGKATNPEVSKRCYPSVGIAMFAKEHEIWESYMSLPGNCVVLSENRD